MPTLCLARFRGAKDYGAYEFVRAKLLLYNNCGIY